MNEQQWFEFLSEKCKSGKPVTRWLFLRNGKANNRKPDNGVRYGLPGSAATRGVWLDAQIEKGVLEFKNGARRGGVFEKLIIIKGSL
jgi:hypothetical protein